MKRSIEALVKLERGRSVALGAAASAVLALAAAAPAAHAVAPVAKLAGSASLTRTAATGSAAAEPASFHVTASFSTDTPGAELFTIQRAVIFFPDHSGTNGRLFRSCSAGQIAAFHGAIGRCPAGSRIGGGTLSARALQLGIDAPGQVAVFNGPGGRSVTFNIQTWNPAYINESIDAPLEQLRGRYGEKVTLVIPYSLQELIPGVFAGIRTFDVTLGAAVRRHGAAYSYFKARTCPRWAIHGVFGFQNWTSGQAASAIADTKVDCTDG